MLAAARQAAHVFTELLPREEAWHEDCEQCERHLERREGPKAPRNYRFVACGIAEALASVGAGATYMQASRIARDRARRFRVDPETGELRESDHGQLVADWVELFAPVVFEPHRPERAPGRLERLPRRPARASPSGSSATPTAACCGQSRRAGLTLSFGSVSGIFSTRLSVYSPRRRGTTPARSWRNSVSVRPPRPRL